MSAPSVGIVRAVTGAPVKKVMSQHIVHTVIDAHTATFVQCCATQFAHQVVLWMNLLVPSLGQFPPSYKNYRPEHIFGHSHMVESRTFPRSGNVVQLPALDVYISSH